MLWIKTWWRKGGPYLGLLVALVGGVLLLVWSWPQSPSAATPPTPPTPTAWAWVWADGQATRVPWRDAFPADAVAQAGAPLFPGDEVRCDGRLVDPFAPQECAVLQVVRAEPLRLYTFQGVRRGSTTAATVGQAAWVLGWRWRVGDVFWPDSATPHAWASAAEYQASRPVRVRTPQREIEIWSTADTVGEALTQGGLALAGLDLSDPLPDAPLPTEATEENTVEVVRVREEVLLEQRPLAYEVRMEATPDLEIDHIQVLQEGALGVEVRRVRVRYENGKEVARQVEASWVAKPPQDRIIGYGTKIVIRTLDTPDGPIRYWRAVRVYATSYSPCRLGTNYCNNITASGRELHKGVVAVVRSWFYAMNGAQVYVPGYGFGVIGDIGGGIPGRPWIDLGYDDDNYVSWHQWVTIYFLAPPPPPENILWILP